MTEEKLFDLFLNISKKMEEMTVQAKSYAGVDAGTDIFFTIDELCKLLKISEPTLRKWVRNNDFPAPIVIAGNKRWASSQINEYIKNNNPHLSEQDRIMAQASEALAGVEL